MTTLTRRETVVANLPLRGVWCQLCDGRYTWAIFRGNVTLRKGEADSFEQLLADIGRARQAQEEEETKT